jgi:tetraacyldisaccharide 4'-kinase
METLRNKIENIMKKGSEARFSSVSEFVLYLFSVVYGIVVRIRACLYENGIARSKRLPCKVVSIGNVTLGGTGKTPLTLYVAELLKRSGYKVVVISRGYGGRSEKSGGILSDGNAIFMDAEQGGDEPCLMATSLRGIPVIVGANRHMAGEKAMRSFGPDVLLLDDAFQHIQLQRDLDICLCDARKPFGNRHLVPRGRLREPVSHLRRAHAIVLTRYSMSEKMPEADRVTIEKYAPGRPVFRCSHMPAGLKNPATGKTHGAGTVTGRKVVAFSGIAENDDFAAMLCGIGADIAGFMSFADHHPYSETDVKEILQTAKDLNVDYIVTTEKDYVRIGKRMATSFPTLVFMISISFGEDADAFESFIKNRLSNS